MPGLENIEYIYVLGSFNIPDEVDDADGSRDRPRYIIWPNARVNGNFDPGMDLSQIQQRLLETLSKDYNAVSEWSWKHENNRSEEYHRGDVVLKSNKVIGWRMDIGGLAYLDFSYNENGEKMSHWSELKIVVPDSKPIPEIRYLFRVPGVTH